MAVNENESLFFFLLHFVCLPPCGRQTHKIRSSISRGKCNWAMRRILLYLVLIAGSLFYGRAYCRQADLQYTYRQEVTAGTFAEYYERRHNFSRAIGVPEHMAEKLVVHNEQNDGTAILYIHGFGASRAEGEAVTDRLAESLGANLYYVRLPGHGLNAEAQAAVTFQDYIQTCEEALLMTPKLGKKVIVVGTSTGGLIATYLAAKYGDKIHAMILASPLWDFGNKTTRILNFPGGFRLASAIMGKERDARWKEDPDKRQHPDYYRYWLMKQKFAALIGLNNLRRYIMNRETVRAISIPVLCLIYYKDAKHQDDTIDIGKIRDWFPELGKTKGGGSKNKLAEIADGNHVLLSEFVRTDKEKILQEMIGWLNTLSNEAMPH